MLEIVGVVVNMNVWDPDQACRGRDAGPDGLSSLRSSLRREMPRLPFRALAGAPWKLLRVVDVTAAHEVAADQIDARLRPERASPASSRAGDAGGVSTRALPRRNEMPRVRGVTSARKRRVLFRSNRGVCHRPPARGGSRPAKS
jgi:hypothetical protein